MMLSQQEIKKRIAQTMSEVVSSLFSMSNETANKQLRASLGEVMQDDGGLLQAALVYQINRLIKSRIKGKGKRCSVEELEAVLAQIRALAPAMAPVLRKELKEMQKRLPRRGGPGREQILNVTEKREACEQVGSLLKMGKVKRMHDIFETVAENFRLKGKQISGRTIKRAWEHRETLFVG